MQAHLNESYNGGNESLKFDAIEDMRKNPKHYQLLDDYEDDLHRFLNLNDYASNSIDMLPYALANITGVCCVVLQADKTGEIHTFYIRPSYDTFDVGQRKEITLIYSPSRQHYDVALTFDEYQTALIKKNETSNIFFDISMDEDEVNKGRFFCDQDDAEESD